MSVLEILEQVESLSSTEQNQVAAFLTHLRHKKDPLFYKEMAERASRKAPAPGEASKTLKTMDNGLPPFSIRRSRQFLERDEVERDGFAGILRSLREERDFQEPNPEDGRLLSIKVAGDYAMTYFFDHAAKEVKVLNVEHTDG